MAIDLYSARAVLLIPTRAWPACPISRYGLLETQQVVRKPLAFSGLSSLCSAMVCGSNEQYRASDEFDLQLARMLQELALPRPGPGSLGRFWQNRWTARFGEGAAALRLRTTLFLLALSRPGAGHSTIDDTRLQNTICLWDASGRTKHTGYLLQSAIQSHSRDRTSKNASRRHRRGLHIHHSLGRV